ncbi:sulfurtransferase TusA family protein [Wohlfahrtiimonas chitiniclastica]|uniref:sulfurtransferase TusA family protein n=1 Tax=Wohlfahrtiimonas chitiniclastica TaxID=400946 RepID=UPI001BCC11C6|nr:sulfurtransferase TusA family protein [Wohlfahrtiimonas chitiniclastica]MBS7815981.1 sulfurtransferase TusA family protein [Wohlfahrtiimonas chitiniclastica]MBS7822024.1 sulfurtransferase TusA family protein [Wohlfahrtiimonas chitiniclastica]MBS7829816.1 sulfurtransferase TusA family protein [Wohlfahrtiimonas chitiniclastica]MBS7831783.1 sulfurtransferase TusA family protein [Wohlfahrtiimonas chitiniclastica]
MAVYELKSLGMVCPFPLLEAKDIIKTLSVGDELKIEFDCTQGTEAIPRWAAESNYTIKDYAQIGDAAWTITVVKTH